MFKKIINCFGKTRLQSDLERFIISKRPTNSAEVEFWIKQYGIKKYGSLLWMTNYLPNWLNYCHT